MTEVIESMTAGEAVSGLVRAYSDSQSAVATVCDEGGAQGIYAFVLHMQDKQYFEEKCLLNMFQENVWWLIWVQNR